MYGFVGNSSLTFFDDYGQKKSKIPAQDAPPSLPPEVPKPGAYKCLGNHSVPFTIHSACPTKYTNGIIGYSYLRGGMEWSSFVNGKDGATEKGLLEFYVIMSYQLYCITDTTGYTKTELLTEDKVTWPLGKVKNRKTLPANWH